MGQTLPGLTGAELRDLRFAFDLQQGQFAKDCGCSISALQKAEANPTGAVGDSILRGVRANLLGKLDVMVALSLSLPAIGAAEAHGLRCWRARHAWWRPQLDRWRQAQATNAKRTFASIDSMAAYLCETVGVDPEDGVLPCDMCVERGDAEPNAAWRRCSKCDAVVCGNETCADYVLEGSLVESPPVVCRNCSSKRDRGDLIGSVSADAPRSEQLRAIWIDLRPRTQPGDAYREGLALSITRSVDAAETLVRKVRGASGGFWPGARTSLQKALAQARREAEALRDLLEEVERSQ